MPSHSQEADVHCKPWYAGACDRKSAEEALYRSNKVCFKSHILSSAYIGTVVTLMMCACPTLCNPMDCQVPLSMGILQARILEWVAMPSL